MNELEKLREASLRISSKSRQEFSVYANLLEVGISLLVKATSIMEKEELRLMEPSKLLLGDTSSTMPMSILACYEQALLGNYPIAKHIFRLVLEEVVSLKFFVEFPSEAVKQIYADKGSDLVSFSEKLKRVNLGPNSSWFGKIHGGLSNAYSHANLVIQPELISEAGANTVLSGGPKYYAGDFSSITTYLLVFATDVVTELIDVFKSFAADHEFLGEFSNHREAVMAQIAKNWPNF